MITLKKIPSYDKPILSAQIAIDTAEYLARGRKVQEYGVITVDTVKKQREFLKSHLRDYEYKANSLFKKSD